MFYLIETKDQLSKLKEKIPFNQYTYLEYIQGNDNTHPALAEVIAIYLNVEDKGYIIPINHPECINWDKDAIFSVLSNYEFKVYDKKAALHLNPQISYTDIQHQTPLQIQHTTQAHAWYYRKFPHTKVNKMIPIGKHLERCNSKYNEIIGFPHVINTYFDNKLLPALYRLEKNALKFNSKFDEYFKPKCKKFSVKKDHIYGWYNPYTTTGRPVNNFNGINFVGLKHDNGERDCFEPDNDFFVEMDYDGYHPRLIGDIVGYRFHGNVHIWEEFNNKGEIVCGGYEIKKENHPKIHAQKLFNYYIQATETYTNVEKINEIQNYLEDKQTKLVLYIYDAFIFDVSKLDGKQTLIDLENILSEKFPIKLKVGKHYGALS